MKEHSDRFRFLVYETDERCPYQGELILTQHVAYLPFSVKNGRKYLTLRCLPNTRYLEDKILRKIGKRHAPKNKDSAWRSFKSSHVDFDNAANAKDGKAERINLVKELVKETKTYLADLNK